MIAPADLDARLAGMSPAELELLEQELADRLWQKRWGKWKPYPWQVPPPAIETLGWWLQLGGRGTGKTDGCARYMVAHVNGPPCDPRLRGGHRMAIIAPTQGDAVEACVNGPSGLRTHDPRVVLRTTAGGTFARWPSGAEAKLFGCHTPDDVERLRAGGNRCLVWMEEVAAQRRLGDAITHSEMGLRIGPNPHYIGSTTPKPRTELIELTRRADVIMTRGRTRDAVHLPQEQRDKLIAKYAGTRTEAQELDGILLEDIEGALWSRAGLDTARVGAIPPLASVVVAMDPAATSHDDADEMGIVVAGRGQQYIPDRNGFARQHGYALDDLSGRMPPVEAARRAIRAYHEHRADAIVAEVNNGGEWIGTVIRQIDPTVNYRTVTASRGKVTRAEPVAALTEQGSAHIVGSLPDLEEQLTTWVPGDSSPDRLDAYVWALTDLMLASAGNTAAIA
ncbi:phage terminase large subunit family protein [Streptomyces acidiscabies]|uniref:DNA-packaging protein n=1 Tax=Streptomyces acidiscabies TaxID=42234 RepID=A0AAP6EH19_9ACTN|nr:terminase family protein [Streptomyces acidiscabies]MBZ3909414.1 DNA-packaging protein [Streptomyces acidiscabies]MDX2962419.1 DNA-packaging protein [Streptomyces acidiscabies]MDX3792438.1 DNA-packaging protein [Streptomyces acidiscabies]